MGGQIDPPPSLKGNSSEGGQIDPPPKLRKILEHKIFYAYVTLLKKNFNRLHRVPGVEIRFLACLTLNFKIQKFSTFFLDFRISIDEFFIFCHIGLQNGLKILYRSYINMKS